MGERDLLVIEAGTLLQQIEIEAIFEPVMEQAEAGQIPSLRYLWDGIGIDNQFSLIEEAIEVLEKGGEFSRESVVSMGLCMAAMREHVSYADLAETNYELARKLRDLGHRWSSARY